MWRLASTPTRARFAAAALDELGRVVGAREFPNDDAGHRRLLEWAAVHGEDRVIGVEGGGSYGAGLARHLLDAGEDVYEVPAFLSYRERKRNPSRGKSDPADAVAIARVAARGEGLCSVRRSEIFVELKLLSDHRDQLVRARTRLINRTHKDLVISHPGYETQIPKLNSKKSQAAARRSLGARRPDTGSHRRDPPADQEDYGRGQAHLRQGQGVGDHSHRPAWHRLRDRR